MTQAEGIGSDTDSHMLTDTFVPAMTVVLLECEHEMLLDCTVKELADVLNSSQGARYVVIAGKAVDRTRVVAFEPYEPEPAKPQRTLEDDDPDHEFDNLN